MSPSLDLTRVSNLIGRDVQVFLDVANVYLRGPIKRIIIRKNENISFDCEWFAKAEDPSGPWTFVPNQTRLDNYPITIICECNDPAKEEIVIGWLTGYICIKRPGDSLKRPT